jgi:lipoprotein-anchoring transpeptidase ErfK/SrfK
MMNRSFFAVNLALALAIPAAPALAQYGPGSSPVYQDDLPPAAGASDDRYMYRPRSQGSPGAPGAPSSILPYPEEGEASALPDPVFVNPDAYGRARDPAYRTDPRAYGRQRPAYQADPNAYGRQQPPHQADPNAYRRQQPAYQGDPNAYSRQQPAYQGNPNVYGRQQPANPDPNAYTRRQPVYQTDPNAYGRQQPTYPPDPNTAARQQPGYQAAPQNPFAIRPPAPIGNAPDAAPQPVPPAATAALPPEDQPELGPPQELPAHLKRQVVDFKSTEAAGTIIVDTDKTYLYLTLGNHKAVRYGIGVGREGFTWSGTERISKMKEWPDWFPPKEMIERQPYLPRMMAGGPGNPLGARALYLGNTLYRIHGTNQPSTIGKTVSSGCIRLLNKDIEDLYSRVKVGTRVVVLASEGPETTAASGSAPGAGTSAPRNNAAVTGGLPPLR